MARRWYKIKTAANAAMPNDDFPYNVTIAGV